MDVRVLIDRLDELLQEARPVPLTDQVRLDRERIYELIDEIRATIPDEVKQARRLVKGRQELFAEATREAERMLSEAREQAARACGQSEIVRLAERRADQLLAVARREGNALLTEVEDRADEHLAMLEANLENFLVAIRRGRERLRERSRETVAAGLHSEPVDARPP